MKPLDHRCSSQPSAGSACDSTEAMNDLEERVAVRYGEAKQCTDKFRTIIKTMNHKEQVEAIDAAQCAMQIVSSKFLLILKGSRVKTSSRSNS